MTCLALRTIKAQKISFILDNVTVVILTASVLLSLLLLLAAAPDTKPSS